MKLKMCTLMPMQEFSNLSLSNLPTNDKETTSSPVGSPACITQT